MAASRGALPPPMVFTPQIPLLCPQGSAGLQPLAAKHARYS
ncbi:Hypothetical protein A7982_03350 [Minicystis rosea]|nr:Hypothetical protein A7982_03350 [Minicystis rosea]